MSKQTARFNRVRGSISNDVLFHLLYDNIIKDISRFEKSCFLVYIMDRNDVITAIHPHPHRGKEEKLLIT